MQNRIRDFGVKIGNLEPGSQNKITDVQGVAVGHSTVRNGDINTGVTSIIPHQRNIFENKVTGASYVVNGFGKTAGLVQLDELGVIETPILLTNTFGVGQCMTSLVRYMLDENEQIGRTTGTINPIVGECNDMFLNDIRSLAVREEHVIEALRTATFDFEEGGVGAGTGMKCFGLKGGIGSASRKIPLSYGNYTLGVLVLSNFGSMENFILNGDQVGRRLVRKFSKAIDEQDKGSIMIIVATDLPVSSRQMKRIIKRSGAGLARTGSIFGNGSGDIVIGFSTANQIKHDQGELQSLQMLPEDDIDQAFMASVEATEEAILNSMVTAETTVGRNGNTLYSLKEFIEEV
ncbi:P1 family peptidase [Sediminibacillus massiliensis]|uniref:DmpA family aminopeptidase n=1 Tax=Sediminibacillus massiliensis TaxID=1926277 RepID=UPI0009888875|nr:P1 family peptidase [Sediminibacillus massiliensis]